MNIKQAQQDILRWIQEFVEVPNSALNDWPPCPFARSARLNDLLEIRAGGADPYVDLRTVTGLAGRDVLILVYDPQEFSAEEFNHLVSSANPAFLAGRGLVALADHPNDCESVNGVIMNQGQYALVFVQDLSKLNQYTVNLAQQGYYHGWPTGYLDILFQGRQDPRS